MDKYCIKWVAAAEIVGIAAGLLTRDGMDVYNASAIKPAVTPPDWVFPVVWTVLYALMGIGACIVSRTSNEKSCGINLFVVQLIVNFFWPLIFFNAQAYGFALAWLVLLWILVLAMTICFYKTKPIAGWLQLPYLIWLTFAAILNAMVWLLNS